MQGQQTDNVATAIQMLAVQNLAPGIRPIALTSPNAFRTERLYTEEVDLLYKKHLVLLKAIYSACRRAPNGGGLRLKVCSPVFTLLVCLDYFGTIGWPCLSSKYSKNDISDVWFPASCGLSGGVCCYSSVEHSVKFKPEVQCTP